MDAVSANSSNNSDHAAIDSRKCFRIPAAHPPIPCRHDVINTGEEKPSKQPIPYGFEAYKVRNTVERCFNKLKHFRRIATRFDRQAVYFLGFLQIAAALIWM
ncbi:transposase [Nitratireductor sp. L1-7-SE]|uniref:Transposase n=1 Tax=Nitratireductor rhodophyticola TaxID=2854036 RepID=A0ABS7RB23_9HYPH|nr:transposase [Nitratireductor rhodophyticola]MBY8921057.1 transposase [Nitratireductor rhodophyticola]